MKQLGAYEAKTHLSRLLDEVEAGESYAITKHGRPVALLVPATAAARDEMSIAHAIEGLRKYRVGRRLEGVTLRELINDGRR
jgi:prevent-host-death family protein